MLTYPRFAKACYAFFAVVVLVAVLKLSVSRAEPALLRMLPAAQTAAVEPAKAAPKGLDDPRLKAFSDDGAERLVAIFSRTASSRTAPSRDVSRAASDRDVPRAASSGSGPEEADDSSGRPAAGAVFRRPSSELGSSSEPVCGDLGGVQESSRVVFPLPEEYFDSYDDTWGAARPQGGHEGSDLMSPAGTPEYALTDGNLVGVAGSNENGWNRLGGYTVMLEAAYDIGPIKKGDLFYYAHMRRESTLPVGARVRAGQRIGTVGDTGEGPEVTRGKFPPHLHLGWYDASLSERRSKVESGAMNPYPLLVWLERNGGAVSGGTDAPYCEAPQGPNPAPSTGELDWPVPSAPNHRPDLDTGKGGDASPTVRKEHRQDQPKRYRGEGGRSDEKQNAQETAVDEANETEEAPEPRDDAKEAKKLSLQKKHEARLDALLRDFPSGDFNRKLPKDLSDGVRSDDDGDRRKDDGQNGKIRDEEPQKVHRPKNDRPKGNQGAPPNDAPKAPAPVAVPDRQPRPVPEKPGDEETQATEKDPQAETPNKVPKPPAPKPVLVPDVEESKTEGEVTPTREEATPAPDGIVNALQGEAVEVPKSDDEE